MSHPSRPWNSLVQRAESCGVSTRAVAVLVAIGACPGVFGQTLVRVHHGSDLSSAIGGQVASLGDVDGDGVPDYCAADVFAEGCPVPPPSIRVYSGASGSEIYGLYSGNGSLWTFSGYGISIDAGADLSGDGIGDIVVGAPYKTPGYGSFGSVYVYSGANGALIRQQFKGIYGEQFGHIVHFLSDLDLDGAVEYGVHSEVDTAHGSKPSITIYSGANGLAHVVMANQYLDTFVRVDDRNGDGIDDVAAGESGWSSGATMGGCNSCREAMEASLRPSLELHIWRGLEGRSRRSRIARVTESENWRLHIARASRSSIRPTTSRCSRFNRHRIVTCTSAEGWSKWTTRTVTATVNSSLHSGLVAVAECRL
jgi:FG-GAP repeat